MPDESKSGLVPTYESGIPVFKPSYEEFRDFRQFVNRIEPVGMKTGIVKIVPPPEWIARLPKLPTASMEQIDIRNPIVQNVTVNGGRGVFGIDNVEKRKKYSIKEWTALCDDPKNQPPARRGEKQRALGHYDAEKGAFVSYDDSDFTPDICEELERRYWKGLSYGGSPMYGADLPGSLFDEHTKEWNVAKLDSLLQLLPEHVPGVTNAYLYCGMWRATFSWHLEDVDLPSINYIHFGAPKQWYTVPQEHHERFYELMSALWPDEQEKCTEFLRHKTFLVEPAYLEKHGITVNKIVHRQQEFIITFPYGYHAGFNYGFNVAESVNFAHDSWLEIGLKSKKCQCVSHSVSIDVDLLVELIQNPEHAAEIRAQHAESSRNQKHSARLAANAAAGGSGIVPRRLGNCVLCPNIYTNQYVRNRNHTARAHVVCANLVPETWIVGPCVSGLETIAKERFALKCLYCKQSKGCCFQCSFPTCTRAYHGSCAASAGVDYRNPHAPMCRFHRARPESLGGNAEQHLAASSLISGDVVQCYRNKAYFAGLVEENREEEQKLMLQKLPNSSERCEVGYGEIATVFTEAPAGPFIEPLAALLFDDTDAPRKKRKTSRDESLPPRSEPPLPTPPAPATKASATHEDPAAHVALSIKAEARSGTGYDEKETLLLTV